MAKIIFYEKPGCGGNAKQKHALLQAGHELEVRNLLSWPWTVETLKPFLGTAPVAEWFNRSAPRVKSGELIPERLSAQEAITLLLSEPLLIRRPLMVANGQYMLGFDSTQVDTWIGLTPDQRAVNLDVCIANATACGASQAHLSSD